MSKAVKPSNPKDLVGSKKVPVELVPMAGNYETALAFLEGALKYGRFNWRKAGVRSSIYCAAHLRHLAKWWNGSDRDPVTRVKHLANARACIDILFDAEWSGKLTDDRPPRQPAIEKRIDDMQDIVAHLHELFADCNPHQYTIADSDPYLDYSHELPAPPISAPSVRAHSQARKASASPRARRAARAPRSASKPGARRPLG